MPTSQNSPKIFITHSWSDLEFARHLYDDLKARGFVLWFDDRSLQAGHRLAEEINRGLEWCDVYIPVISRKALSSKWCWEEINAAITLSNQPGRGNCPQIIPVIVEDCKIPALLASRLYINFANRYDAALGELLQKGLCPFPGRLTPSTGEVAPVLPENLLVAAPTNAMPPASVAIPRAGDIPSSNRSYIGACPAIVVLCVLLGLLPYCSGSAQGWVRGFILGPTVTPTATAVVPATLTITLVPPTSTRVKTAPPTLRAVSPTSSLVPTVAPRTATTVPPKQACSSSKPLDANAVYGVVLDPPSPGNLRLGQKISVSFKYVITEAEGLPIFASGLNNGRGNTRYDPSGVIPPGEGSLQRNFYSGTGQGIDAVDEVKLQMGYNSEIFFICFVPVQYHFGS